MAIPNGYIGAIVNYASLSADNLTEVKENFSNLYKLCQAGKGKILSSQTTNSKSFTWDVRLTTHEDMVAHSQAIDIIAGNRSSIVYARYF